MVKVKVSATSANLGPGFDSIGIALNMYNQVWFRQSDSLRLFTNNKVEKLNKNSLYLKSVKSVFELCGERFFGIDIIQKASIPSARGLGSSSACIAAGLSGANMLLKSPLKTDDLINLASKLEGHPDNTTPCFVGGLCCCIKQGDIVYYSKIPVDKSLMFCAFVPQFRMPTSESRSVLPKSLSYEDASYNISRSAYLISLFYKKQYDNLEIALGDRLHQPYRLLKIKDADKIFSHSKKLGAYGTYLSGAGPTIISIVDVNNKSFIKESKEYLKQNLKGWKLKALRCAKDGIKCEYDNIKGGQ